MGRSILTLLFFARSLTPSVHHSLSLSPGQSVKNDAQLLSLLLLLLLPEGSQLGPQGQEWSIRCSHGSLCSCLGLLRRLIQGQEVRVPTSLWLLCHGKCSVQGVIP